MHVFGIKKNAAAVLNACVYVLMKRYDLRRKTMKKRKLVFWTDLTMFSLLMLSMLTIIPGAVGHEGIHVLPGTSILLIVIFHLWQHKDWILNASRRFRRMPAQAQGNALIDLSLLGTYTLCGALGLTARMFSYSDLHTHIVFGLIHAGMAMVLLFLQTLHLARHYKWIKGNLRSNLPGDRSTFPSAH
jgi:hypothetical protein